MLTMNPLYSHSILRYVWKEVKSLFWFSWISISTRLITSAPVNSNPNSTHSNLACNSPTRWSKSRGKSLGDTSVLFSSRKLWFIALHLSSWKIHRLCSYNDWVRYTWLYCYSWLGQGQHSKSVTSRRRIELVVSEESHFYQLPTGKWIRQIAIYS